jgi:hypothetical protein
MGDLKIQHLKKAPIFLHKKTNSNMFSCARVTIQTDIPPSSEKENTKVERKKRCRARFTDQK